MSTTVDQDVVPQPTATLRELLVLARAVAGHRGRAGVIWHGQAHTYTLLVQRDPGADTAAVEVDADTSGDGLAGAGVQRVAELVELLAVVP